MRRAVLLALWGTFACKPAGAPLALAETPTNSTPEPRPQADPPAQASAARPPLEPTPAALIAAAVRANPPVHIDRTTFHWTLGEAVRAEAGEVPTLGKPVARQLDTSLPVLEGDEATQILPGEIGALRLVRAIDHGDHLVGLYSPDELGATVVLAVRPRGKVLSFIDFERYRFEPGMRPEDGPGVDQRVQWARVRDGVLFVSQSHPLPGTPLEGYLGAFDAATGTLRWRTESKVSNLENFVFFDGYVLTGYASAKGKHVIHAVRMADGSVELRRRIPQQPVSLGVAPPYVQVMTLDGPMVFPL